MATKHKRRVQDLPILHPDAAGIDIGSNEIFVAVPAERDPESVRSFSTFTRDLYDLADGYNNVALNRWRWNRPASTGYPCTRFWRLVDSKSSW